MGVELEQIAKYLGFNSNLEWDEVKPQIDAAWVKADVDAISEREDLHKSIMGKANHNILASIKSLAKEAGVEVSWKDFEGKKTTEVIEHIGNEIKGLTDGYQSKLTDLETAVKEAKKSGASAKDVEALQTEVENWKNKHNEVEGQWKSVAEEFETYKSSAAEEKKSNLINQNWQKALDIPLETSSDYERDGFIGRLKKKYSVDVDGEETIVRGEDGKRIPHPEKKDSFIGLEDVVKMEADKAGFINKNPHKDKPVRPNTPPVIPGGNNGQQKEKHTVTNPMLRQ